MGNVVGIGGTPPLALLRELVAREVAALKATGIIPFFVFNGLPWKRDKPFSAEDYRPAKRAKAWDDYEQGRENQGKGMEMGRML